MKKAKVFISLLCAMALVLGSFPAMGFADEGDITVIVDGVTLDPAEGKAQIVGSGTTMVPFRAIFEALGFEVDYRESDGVVTSVMGYNIEENILIGLVVGENVIYMCTYSKYLDDIRALVSSPYSTMSEAVFIDETGRTLIPARAVSEALGAEVVWVAESKTVIITYATEHYYRATDIPRYEYVTGDAYTSVSYDAYRNPTYVYPYPESLDKFNYDYKRDALSDEGVVLIDQNADDISQQQTWLFESQANNYLLIRLDEYEELIYITPYSNKVYPYYITGLSGTGISMTECPNYAHYEDSECLSWTEDESGNHTYKYKYDYDYYEYDKIDHYCWLIETSGYECYWSSENRWSFANNGHFIDVETDAALGYVYVTPFAENSAFETGYYYGDGDTYYNTDIPTFSSVTDIKASSVKDSDYGAVMFTYVCTEREYRAYIRELEIVGFVDVSGDYTMLESPTNKYVLVLRNDSSVSVVAFDAYETYLNTGVPNYTAVTGAECLFWNTDEDGNHIYYYSFISLFTSEMTTYDAYLSDAGYESFYEETTEEYAVMYMTNGSSVVSIMSLLIDGTFYIAITPWMTENIS